MATTITVSKPLSLTTHCNAETLVSRLSNPWDWICSIRYAQTHPSGSSCQAITSCSPCINVMFWMFCDITFHPPSPWQNVSSFLPLCSEHLFSWISLVFSFGISAKWSHPTFDTNSLFLGQPSVQALITGMFWIAIPNVLSILDYFFPGCVAD